jgi:hypothetical protein
MRINPHKTVCAGTKGIIISFRDANKHRFLAYENVQVEEIQTKGHVKYQSLEQPAFNKLQQKLYAEAVYGLGYYSHEAVQQMSKSKKLRVLAKYAKAQRILNRWKQEIVYEKVDRFFMDLFPKSSITKALVETNGYDREIRESHTFKELGLSPQDVASKLVETNLLPKDFFELAV